MILVESGEPLKGLLISYKASLRKLEWTNDQLANIVITNKRPKTTIGTGNDMVEKYKNVKQ